MCGYVFQPLHGHLQAVKTCKSQNSNHKHHFNGLALLWVNFAAGVIFGTFTFT